MAVTKQAYSCVAPWVASQLANAFQSAFIDAGLMQAWHDEWATGLGAGLVLHRVIRIVYDSGKRYGTVFHWFAFQADAKVYYSVSHQWDTVNHRPIGVIGVDYVGSGGAYNPAGSHRLFGDLLLSTTVTLTRYTSNVKAGFSMFLLKAGNEYFVFFFVPPDAETQPFVDLDLNTCGGLMIPVIDGSTATDSTSVRMQKNITFQHLYILKNSIFDYGKYAFTPSDFYISSGTATGIAYRGTGRGSSNSFSSTQYTGDGDISASSRIRNEGGVSGIETATTLAIALPAEKVSANSNRTSDNTPVFSDLPFSMYFLDRLPLDIGIAWHYVNSTMEVQDVFQVTPGVEEWEIISVTNSSDADNPSPMVLARIV